MSESRTALLAWVNDLLSLSVTKVEQMGTGAAYCQIVDSIFGDVPLSKVKFNANQEFQYVQNWKLVQNAFKNHNIDQYIPVDRLVKLKFQDNLEFMQFVKKYWDGHYGGGDYDAIGRRRGKKMEQAKAAAGPAARRAKPLALNNKPAGNVMKTAAAKKDTSSGLKDLKINELNNVITDLRVSLENVERERDFYFEKLRQIEVICGGFEGQEEGEHPALKQIQETLYQTADGFEIPNADAAIEGVGAADLMASEEVY